MLVIVELCGFVLGMLFVMILFDFEDLICWDVIDCGFVMYLLGEVLGWIVCVLGDVEFCVVVMGG